MKQVFFADLFQEIFNSNGETVIVYGTYDFGTPYEAANTQFWTTHYLTSMNSWRLENSTDLDIVKTAIHESIHATLLYFYNNPDNNFNDPNNSNPTYAELVDMFNEHRETYGNTGQTQHEYMTSLVGQISDAIEVWADANGYENVPSSYFDKLAWGGLTFTASFNYYFQAGSSERSEIEQIISNELSSFSDAQGTQASTINCN